MIDRRLLLMSAATIAATASSNIQPALAKTDTSPVEMGDNGLHIQSWFLESFLDLAEDRSNAAANGKILALVFEQRGCPYCREMHRVNFARKDITDFLKANFELLQMDLWGSRDVTDFDGQEIPEKKLARKWRVNFTPTIVFIKPGDDDTDPLDMEVARMPGYFKPFHFLSMFEFVQKRLYEEIPFQRYLQDKFAALEAKGIKPDVW